MYRHFYFTFEKDDLNVHKLFSNNRTKKLIVEIMRVQQGETLTQILETSATRQQEMEHNRLQKARVDVDKKKSSAVQRSSSAVGDSK